MRINAKYENLIDRTEYDASMERLFRLFAVRKMICAKEFFASANDVFNIEASIIWNKYEKGLLTEDERAYLAGRLLDIHTNNMRRAAIEYNRH